ncbi:MAG: helix-hairpin-helix domain-containing protein [Candidatus ainarchaeum sp.]|nr:helix-hairpin-helix domain-containing protein [Candidatus ainarchaeum sp.]
MLLEKLRVLGNSASWDSCGGVRQKSLRKVHIPAELENIVYDCSNTSENCRLMKVLQSNSCIHDCNYCANTCKSRKEELEPIELAQSFNFLEKKGIVQGLFLSSAVTADADRSTEKIIESAKIIRKKFGFKGYLHLKVLPGSSKEKIFETAEYANRISLNLEAVDASLFSEMSSTKNYQNDLIKRLFWIDEANKKGLLPSGFTTQIVVGALGETDSQVLQRMDWLYENTSLHRAYFSAFSPVKGTKFESHKAESKNREHMLYQADWLLRVYDFKKKEIESATGETGNFSLNHDLKLDIAMNNPDKFPLDINTARREELLRVPGIGPKTSEKIILLREEKKFRETEELKQAGIAGRALPFIQLEKEKQAKIKEFF